MKSIISQGKNVSKAIEAGLKELNVTQDEVNIKILDEGGIFRKAKVELTLDKEVEETKKQEKAQETLKNECENVDKKEDESIVNKVKIEKQNTTENNTEKTNTQSKKEYIKTKNLNKNEVKENLQTQESKIDVEKLGKEFLENLFKKMNIVATVESFENDQGVTFNASGEKVSNLIGKRGETLNAIQEVLSNVLKNVGYREKRVYFDVENYKNRREMSLITLAERMSAKAIKIGKPIKLERMSAYERKIIHTALQNIEGVTSKSEGEEPNRRLVIIPSKKD